MATENKGRLGRTLKGESLKKATFLRGSERLRRKQKRQKAQMSSDTCSTRRQADVFEIREREDAACRVMDELIAQEQEQRQSEIKQERVSQGDSTHLLSLAVWITLLRELRRAGEEEERQE
jgi:hypothetical protein